MEKFIGIDPGVKNGWAVWNRRAGQIEALETLSYSEVIIRMFNLRQAGETVTFVIEDPSQNRPVFERKITGITRADLKIAQEVGGNKQGGKILIGLAADLGFPVRTVRPQSAKWDPQTFFAITKKPGVFSQHARDAAKLVFGL